MRWPTPMLGLLLVGLLGSCHAAPRAFRARPLPDARGATAISRALSFLAQTQATETDEELGTDWVGNWPQRLGTVGGAVELCDVNAGLPAFIHHALTPVHEGTAAVLALSAEDVAAARTMRVKAVALLRRFAVPHASGVPSYGWWPPARRCLDPFERVAASIIERAVGGPRPFGILAPIAVRAQPRSLGIWPDADDTAYVRAALMEGGALDGTEPPPPGLGKRLAAWRDLDGVRREFPAWLERGSGAFLTWIDHGGHVRTPNDVDVAANANVLWSLAMAGERDSPGFDEAIALVNRAVLEGSVERAAEVSLYYPDVYVIHAVIARAFALGPVPELAPAVERLADDIERAARRHADGSVSWGRRARPLSTALALTTLLHAGRDSPLVPGGVQFLEQTQDPRSGAWPEAIFARGTTTRGQVMRWRSRASSTAAALMALALAKIAAANAAR